VAIFLSGFITSTVGSSDRSSRAARPALLVHAQDLRTLAVQAQPDLLQVQHDVGDVLHHARDRRELVQHAADLHRGDRGALERREQHAPQRVAEREPEPALERLAGELAVGLAAGGVRLQLAGRISSRQFFAIVSCRSMCSLSKAGD
jgi:hypothetical protein